MLKIEEDGDVRKYLAAGKSETQLAKSRKDLNFLKARDKNKDGGLTKSC
jgi:hypothetical protein